MRSKDNILLFHSVQKPGSIAKVALSDYFCESTNRPLGSEGVLKGIDERHDDIGIVVVEGEVISSLVHMDDYTIIG